MKAHLLVLSFALCLVAAARAESPRFEKALPVWSEGDSGATNCVRVFEGEFVWNGRGEKPILRLASAYGCRIELNGCFAGYGPARAAKGWFRVDEWTLKDARPGTNRIALVSLAHNTPTYQWVAQPAFIQAEVLAPRNGTVEVLLCSQELRVRESETYLDSKEKYSFQRGWKEAYRVGQGSVPRKARQLKIACGTNAPSRLLPRRIPYPRFDVRELKKGANGLCDGGFNDTGFLIVVIRASKAGSVEVKWDEILSEGVVNPRRLGCDNTLKIAVDPPGEYRVETLEPYTGRWFELTATDGIEASLSLRTYKHPCAADKSEKGAPELRKVLRAARETFAQNAADCFMDCPSRERAGWLCDSFFLGRAERFFTGKNDIERAFLENYAVAESFDGLPEGMVPMCYPADHNRTDEWIVGRNFIPNWAMWLVVELDDYVRRTGDRKMAEQLRPKLDALYRYFQSFKNADGLLENLKGWVFVEWSKANDFVEGVNYPSNMMYAEMLSAMARLYSDSDKAREAESVRSKIREQSFDGQFFRDHNRSADATETCQYYAFFTRTATRETHPDLWKRLVSDFGPKRNPEKTWAKIHPSNAFIGNYLRFELLHQTGLQHQIRNEALAYFTRMAERTGTLWEHSAPSASCCHGFASYIAVLLAGE